MESNNTNSVSLIIFVIGALLMGWFINVNRQTASNVTYFMDIVKTNTSMMTPENIPLDEIGSYDTFRLNDNQIRIFDNSSRILYLMNLNEQSIKKIYNSGDLGRGHLYKDKTYLISKHLFIWENSELKTQKKLFEVDAESDVYINNIGIVSLKKGKGIHGVDLETKEINWSIKRSNMSNHIDFLINKNNLYYTDGGNLYKLNYLSGEEKKVRKLEPSGDGDESPMVLDGDMLYTGGNYLHKVNFNTWETIDKIEMEPHNILIDNDFIYVSTRYPAYQLYKINKSSFEVVWHIDLYDNIGRIELLDDYLSVKNSKNQVGLIDKNTGEFVWTKEFDATTSKVFPYGNKHHLVIVSENGEIFYYDTTTLKDNN